MKAEVPFGAITWNADLQVRGAYTEGEFLAKLPSLVDFLGMELGDMQPCVQTYPLPEGAGGMGLTIYQPFVEPLSVFQGAKTSFLVIDAWPELNLFTITVKCCIEFCPVALRQEVLATWGVVVDMYFWALGGRSSCRTITKAALSLLWRIKKWFV